MDRHSLNPLLLLPAEVSLRPQTFPVSLPRTEGLIQADR